MHVQQEGDARPGSSAKMTFKAKISLVGLVLGVLVLAAALVVPGLVLRKLHSGVVDHVTLKPEAEDRDAFFSWKNNTDPSKDPDSFFTVRFYNLTNKAAVLNGSEEPRVEELPQITFRRMRVYYNTSFSDDNNEVTYNEQLYYEFDADASEGDLDMEITGVWPTYLALLRKAGGTTQHAVAALANQLIGGLMDPVFTLFHGVGQAQWGRLAGIPHLVNASETLANATGFRTIVHGQSPMFAAVMEEAAGSAQKYYPEFAAFLKFNPTGQALSFLGAKEFTNDTVLDNLLASGKCPLFTGTFPSLPGPAAALAGVPCAAALQGLVQMSAEVPAAKEVLAEFFPVGLSADASVTQWGALAAYLEKTSQQYLTNLVTGYAKVDSLESALWSTRKPTEWLFDFEDPLLALLRRADTRPNAHNSAYFKNEETEDEAFGTNPGVTTTRTGRQNPDKALTYLRWHNYTTLPQRTHGSAYSADGVWCNTTVKVEGHDDTQFPILRNGWFTWSPGISETEVYPVWIPQLSRPGHFVYKERSHARGIEVWRYHLADSEFEPSGRFGERFGGVLNMTCPQGGVPAMLTEPRYFRVSDKLNASARVDGVPEPVPEKHDTFLDVDPVSGTTLRGYKRLQINMWADKGTSGMGAGTPDKLVPALWIEQREELTKKNAHKYENTVQFALDLRRHTLYGGLVVGGVLFLLGLAGLVSSRKKRAAVDNEHGDALLQRPVDDSETSTYL